MRGYSTHTIKIWTILPATQQSLLLLAPSINHCCCFVLGGCGCYAPNLPTRSCRTTHRMLDCVFRLMVNPHTAQGGNREETEKRWARGKRANTHRTHSPTNGCRATLRAKRPPMMGLFLNIYLPSLNIRACRLQSYNNLDWSFHN